MLNGRLMHYQHAQAQAFPMYAKKIAPGEEHYTYTTIFDYGQYRHGVEAAPGVAFETTPYERNRVSALENHTLARTALPDGRSEEHTSELQSIMRLSYAVFCLKTKINTTT